MKRIMIVLLAFTINLNAQSKEQKSQSIDKVDKVIDKTSNAIERVYNDGSKIVEKSASLVEKSAPKIEKALNKLGQDLKVGANKVWDILILQQLVYSICILILIVTTILSWIHFYYRLNEARKNNWGNIDDTPNSYHMIFIITLTIAIIGTIYSGIHFIDMMTGFINPEFGAMKTIAEIASQIK